jgi:hypothetical protein
VPDRHVAILINKYRRLFVYLGAVWYPAIAESSQCGFDRMGYETPSRAAHPAIQFSLIANH